MMEQPQCLRHCDKCCDRLLVVTVGNSKITKAHPLFSTDLQYTKKNKFV